MKRSNIKDGPSSRRNGQQLSYQDSFSEQLHNYQQTTHPYHPRPHNTTTHPHPPTHTQTHTQQLTSHLPPSYKKQTAKTSTLHPHKRGKSMDLNEIHAFEADNLHYQPKKSRKVVVNGDFIANLKSRNAISEMKNYELCGIKQACVGGKGHKKKSNNDLITNYHNISNKPLSQVFSIYQNKGRHLKNHQILKKQPSKTFSMKPVPKQDKKNQEIILERRCKSSLKDKYNLKILNQLKSIGNKIPLISKLNSLYSNTTSIYNSYSQLQTIKANQSLRIPTEETTEIYQIRKYQSEVLVKQEKGRYFRNSHLNSGFQELNEDLSSKNNQTKQLISHYISFLSQQGPKNHSVSLSQSQQFIEIKQPKSYEEMHQLYANDAFSSNNQLPVNHLLSYDAVELKDNIEKEWIKKIQSQTSFQVESNVLQQNLDKIITLIKNQQKLEFDDKKLIISTIKQLIERQKDVLKKDQQKQYKQQKQQRQNKQQESIVQSSSSYLNSLSIKESTQEELDINFLNLQLLDTALRKRENALKQEMDGEMERIQRGGEQVAEVSSGKEFLMMKKWFQSEIKEVQKIRNQLWKGFNNAKKLVYQNMNDRNCEIAKSKSQKYFKKPKPKIKKLSNQKPKNNKTQPLIPQKNDKNTPNNQHSPKQYHKQKIRIQTEQYYQSPDLIMKEKQLIDLVSSNRQHFYYNSNEKSSLNSFQIINSGAKEIDFSNDPEQKEKSPVLTRSNYIKFDDMFLIKDDDDNLTPGEYGNHNVIVELALEDKQAIFQFIFMDLCIELRNQYEHQHRILRKICSFGQKVEEQAAKIKGFRTNSNYIKEYLYQFLNFLKKNSNFLIDIHINLDQSTGPTEIQFLKYINEYKTSETNYLPSQIINIHLFDLFESSYMKNARFEVLYDQDEEKEEKRQKFLRNLMHIHNKSIFDTLNEQLDKHRLFGSMGRPFKWKKAAKFNHNRTVKQKNQIIMLCCQKSIEHSTFMCGYMVDKQDCPLKNNRNISVEYIEQIHFDRLSKLLADKLEQIEQKMGFIDDDEAEYMINLANIMTEVIIIEAIHQITQFS